MAKFSAAAETVTVTFSSSAIVALIFITLIQTGPLNCAPCEVVNSAANTTNASAANTTNTSTVKEVLDSLVAGLKVSFEYAHHLQGMTTILEEPLISVNGSSSEQLLSILKDVCDLLSFYEFYSKMEYSRDLYLLFTQNIVDSCNWLNYLVTDNVNVSASEKFLQLPETCAPNDTPRLHQYCLQRQVREEDGLSGLLQGRINNKLRHYYPAPVTHNNQCQWLQSKCTITVDVRDRIEDIVNLDCTE